MDFENRKTVFLREKRSRTKTSYNEDIDIILYIKEIEMNVHLYVKFNCCNRKSYHY